MSGARTLPIRRSRTARRELRVLCPRGGGEVGLECCLRCGFARELLIGGAREAYVVCAARGPLSVVPPRESQER